MKQVIKSKGLKSFLTVMLILFCMNIATAVLAEQQLKDPLPSWNDGVLKGKLVEFVKKSTNEKDPGYIEPADRIAVFDNDGTIWPERPYGEMLWLETRIQELLKEKPDLAIKEGPFKVIHEKGLAAMADMPAEEIRQIYLQSEGTLASENLQEKSAAFVNSAKHPKLGRPYTKIAYLPMVELMDYLRANGFKVYICTGGNAAFVRGFSEQLYGVVPEQVIGTSLKMSAIEENGKIIVWNEPAILHNNDKMGKPVGIEMQIGKRPVFAAGNEGGGGDIAMLRYSQGSKNSMQILVNHDDAEREIAYTEKDNASLDAARKYGWNVISIKNDWKTIFKD